MNDAVALELEIDPFARGVRCEEDSNGARSVGA
jgi:hypothetical protein